MKIILNSLDISSIPEIHKLFKDIGLLINIPAERKEVLENVSKANAYLASAAVKIDREFLDLASNLQVIGSPSTGTDHMDLDLIKKRGIKCFDISKEFKLLNSFTATSELVFTLLLSLTRKIVPAYSDAKNGVWSREQYTGVQLYEKTFGILGLGRLGTISAKIANGFGMKVIAYDLQEKNVKNVKMVDFETLASQSDFLSVHIHLNKSTENIIDINFLNKMKKTAIIINTSRGKVINEKDLLFALKNSIISGAALDVIDGEWLNKENLYRHSLIEFSRNNNNLLISPHIGGATMESIYGSRVFMAKKIANFLKKIN